MCSLPGNHCNMSFATAAPTILPPENTGGGGSVKVMFTTLRLDEIIDAKRLEKCMM